MIRLIFVVVRVDDVKWTWYVERRIEAYYLLSRQQNISKNRLQFDEKNRNEKLITFPLGHHIRDSKCLGD